MTGLPSARVCRTYLAPISLSQNSDWTGGEGAEDSSQVQCTHAADEETQVKCRAGSRISGNGVRFVTFVSFPPELPLDPWAICWTN